MCGCEAAPRRPGVGLWRLLSPRAAGVGGRGLSTCSPRPGCRGCGCWAWGDGSELPWAPGLCPYGSWREASVVCRAEGMGAQPVPAPCRPGPWTSDLGTWRGGWEGLGQKAGPLSGSRRATSSPAWNSRSPSPLTGNVFLISGRRLGAAATPVGGAGSAAGQPSSGPQPGPSVWHPSAWPGGAGAFSGAFLGACGH